MSIENKTPKPFSWKKTGSRLQNIIRRLTSNEILWLILICFSFRTIYQSLTSDRFWYYSDTASYYYAAQHITEMKIDAFRTPVYPAVISIFQHISPYNTFGDIVVFQKLISLLSLLPFYLFCRQFFRNKYLAYMATLAYGCLPPIFIYNNGICPESLLISSFALLPYLFLNNYRKPGPGRSLLLSSYLLYLVLLKPACIYLYPIAVLFLLGKFWSHRMKRIIAYEISVLAISVLVVFGYCLENKKKNGYFGLTTATHDNNFANIILSDAYKTLDDKRFVAIVDTLKPIGHYYTVYYLNNDHDKYQRIYDSFPKRYGLTWDMIAVKETPASKYDYSKEQIDSFIKKAMMSRTFLWYIVDNFIQFTDFDMLYIQGYVWYLLLLTEALFVMYMIVRRKKFPWRHMLVFLITSGLICTTLIAGINDATRGRVLIPIAPFLCIILFSVMDRVLLLSGKLLNYSFKKYNA